MRCQQARQLKLYLDPQDMTPPRGRQRELVIELLAQMIATAAKQTGVSAEGAEVRDENA
jgi:hypothetical protein